MTEKIYGKDDLPKIDKEIFKYLASHKPNAIAQMRGGEEFPEVEGAVEFYAFESGVMVVADVENLPKTETNIFAFHIHEGNSCENNFAETGSHFNPKSVPHPQHAGDLPPLFSCGGNAWQSFFSDRFRLEDVIGRVVVIHKNPDDFTTQPAGNSGTKIACGKIEKV